ncbi:MAG: hypothetical protein QM756_04360 [Polyangiaceae bacterium]
MLIGRVLVIATTREPVLSAPVSDKRLRTLKLGSLEPSACRDIVQAWLGRDSEPPSVELIDACSSLSDGNPGRLEQTLLAFEAHRAIEREQCEDCVRFECDDERIRCVSNLLIAERLELAGWFEFAASAYFRAAEFARRALGPREAVSLIERGLFVLPRENAQLAEQARRWCAAIRPEFERAS